MTAKEIQTLVAKDFLLRGHPFVCENVKYLFSDWEHDVVTISKNGFIYEFEVKLSRRDFTGDRRKKRKWEAYSINTHSSPNYFSYVFGEDVVIPVEEINSIFGIYQVIDNVLQQIRRPKALHKHEHPLDPIKDKFLRLYAQRRFLGMALLTHKNKRIVEGKTQEKEHNFKTESNEPVAERETNPDLFENGSSDKKEEA